MKKWFATALCTTMLVSALPYGVAKADAVIGESIYTLGENLTATQKQSLLTEMDYQESEKIIYVSNKEEHDYLGEYIPKAQIGTRALSSSKLTHVKKDTGIVVSTQNISWVTAEMYTNALLTAGVKDAHVYVTAPFPVSGTAALTGLIKAYEQSTGNEINEEKKQVANEEMVTTAELGDKIGEDQANNLMTNIKDEIAKEQPKTEEEIRDIVVTIAGDLNININEINVDQLVILFEKMDQAGVDWNGLRDQLDVIKEQWGDRFEEVSQGFLQSVSEAISGFFQSILDWVKSVFEGFGTNTEEPNVDTNQPENENTPSQEEQAPPQEDVQTPTTDEQPSEGTETPEDEPTTEESPEQPSDENTNESSGEEQPNTEENNASNDESSSSVENEAPTNEDEQTTQQ